MTFSAHKRQNLGTDRDPDVEPLKFVLDDLGHVCIHPGQDMRLAFVQVYGLAQGLKAFGHFEPYITGSDNRHPRRLLERFVDADRILKIDDREDIFEVRARNIRELRPDAGCDEKPVVGELCPFAGVRLCGRHPFTRW